jgi:hypothetical protein
MMTFLQCHGISSKSFGLQGQVLIYFQRIYTWYPHLVHGIGPSGSGSSIADRVPTGTNSSALKRPQQRSVDHRLI